MKKKNIFTIFFVLIASGILVFTINESLKRIEKSAVSAYLSAISEEFAEHYLYATIDEVECHGFIKHTCAIPEIKINGLGLEIHLYDTHIAISHISPSDIGVAFRINRIAYSANDAGFVLLPRQFTYTFALQKRDSALGYVALNRAVALDFEHFSFEIAWDVLVRGQNYRNRSIFYLLREWFDKTTPSFYEYSLDSLSLTLAANATPNPPHIAQIRAWLDGILAREEYLQKPRNALIDEYFDRIIAHYYELLNGEIAQVDLRVERKNKLIEYFNLISNEAARKKSLEILETLESINDTYDISLEVK